MIIQVSPKNSTTCHVYLIKYLGINDLNEVFQDCKHCSAKWEEIGLNLGVYHSTLDIIKTDNPLKCEKCMSEMLSKWLKKENEKCIPSWRSLCQALYNIDRSTADQIAEKHHITIYTKHSEGI